MVGLLLLLALDGHTKCVEGIAGSPVTHWTIVPFLPAKSNEHPLRGLVVGRAPGTAIHLLPAANARDRRVGVICPSAATSAWVPDLTAG